MNNINNKHVINTLATCLLFRLSNKIVCSVAGCEGVNTGVTHLFALFSNKQIHFLVYTRHSTYIQVEVEEEDGGRRGGRES